MNWPVAMDLFSGAGGLSQGLRDARFRILAAVELDPLAAASYRMNFPSVRLWNQDIRTLDPEALRNALRLEPGELDLLAGCPPCQGFSTIRTRHGRTVRDPRNRLIQDFLAFVREFRPRAVMLENVPGVARYQLFRSFLRGLRAMGYKVDYRVFDAADFGVPQRRRRLLLAATHSIELVFGEPSKSERTVRDAIQGLPAAGSSGDPLHDLPENRADRIQRLIAAIPIDGGSRSALSAAQVLACHSRTDGFKDVYGRMRWDAVAPTLTGGCVNPSKGRFLHPSENRAITLREALLLQAFPKGYQLSLARGKFRAAELVGNAVPPPLVAAHASALRRSLVATVSPIQRRPR